ncbi:MAG: type II toxin-antitoxin system prevent-host-death family antitoxin [Geminicoccaceae bacterium]
MIEVGTYEAKTNFSKLLERVAAGETVVITSRGRPVAKLVGVDDDRRARAQAAVARILELRKQIKPVSIEEILSARDEGRRY